jgi:prepilin peptidase CpaA
LLAVAALWLGPLHLGQFGYNVGLAGGALALFILFFRRFPPPKFLIMQPWAMKLHDRSTGIPYGVAITAGAMIVFPSATLYTKLLGA